MLKITALFLICAACAAQAGGIQPETFVIHASRSGREATIKIPVGAVSAFSANNAEALPDSTGPQSETMRLSGNVRIDVVGTPAPLQIKADSVVLELTADEAPVKAGSAPLSRQPMRQLSSAQVIVEDDETQAFVGNVVFTVQTSSGAMQIKADRVERVIGAPAAEAPAAEAPGALVPAAGLPAGV
jgi:lipopolysaccharide export system protein LptA